MEVWPFISSSWSCLLNRVGLRDVRQLAFDGWLIEDVKRKIHKLLDVIHPEPKDLVKSLAFVVIGAFNGAWGASKPPCAVEG